MYNTYCDLMKIMLFRAANLIFVDFSMKEWTIKFRNDLVGFLDHKYIVLDSKIIILGRIIVEIIVILTFDGGHFKKWP